MAKKQSTDLVRIEEAQVQPRMRLTCKTCVAWRPSFVQDPSRPGKMVDPEPFWGGCARSGKITTFYGDDQFRLTTTDMQTCTRWSPNEDMAAKLAKSNAAMAAA